MNARNTKTLVFFAVGVIFITIGVLLSATSAHAATPSIMHTAIGRAKVNGEHSVTVIQGLDGTPISIEIWDYHAKQCGDRTGLNITDAKLDAIYTVTSMLAFTVTKENGGDAAIVIGDINADGIVDFVPPNGAMTIEKAQSMFDAIVTCIVTNG